MLPFPYSLNTKNFFSFVGMGSFINLLVFFCLASAPWAFTKLLKPVVAFLRKRGIPLIMHLDDILILNESKIGAEEDFALAVSILERC